MQFSAALKNWRRRRGYSQEKLGFEASVSARHIAFIETGRARPSREMVIRLSDALDVPLADRNELLQTAGFASLYQSRALDAADMAPIKAGLDWMLSRHEPFPAFAIDRHWRLLSVNPAAMALLRPLGIGLGDSLIDAALNPDGLRRAIVNWADTAHYFARRLRTESSHLGGDSHLLDAANRLAAESAHHIGAQESLPAVLNLRFRVGEAMLSFYSTIAHFGSSDDIALADVKIEFLFPSDDATRLAMMKQ